MEKRKLFQGTLVKWQGIGVYCLAINIHGGEHYFVKLTEFQEVEAALMNGQTVLWLYECDLAEDEE